jgi:hypothetical protein
MLAPKEVAGNLNGGNWGIMEYGAGKWNGGI